MFFKDQTSNAASLAFVGIVLAVAFGFALASIPSSAAAQNPSGLRSGDIIIAVNGRAVHDADSLVLEVGRLPVESRVRLTIVRDGQQRPLTVKLGKYPVRGKKIVTNRPSHWHGIHIDYPTILVDDGNRVARMLGYFEDAVLVTEVKHPALLGRPASTRACQSATSAPKPTTPHANSDLSYSAARALSNSASPRKKNRYEPSSPVRKQD